jgi:xanthine dehydrogenase iron-sulfur cluster and FAD-binding subunit A
MMATQALVERGGEPTRADVIEALSGHVCRCTGYVKIIDAATAAIRGDVDVRGTEADMGPHDPDEVQLIPGSPA